MKYRKKKFHNFEESDFVEAPQTLIDIQKILIK